MHTLVFNDLEISKRYLLLRKRDEGERRSFPKWTPLFVHCRSLGCTQMHHNERQYARKCAQCTQVLSNERQYTKSGVYFGNERRFLQSPIAPNVMRFLFVTEICAVALEIRVVRLHGFGSSKKICSRKNVPFLSCFMKQDRIWLCIIKRSTDRILHPIYASYLNFFSVNFVYQILLLCFLKFSLVCYEPKMPGK